jgi:glycosyltransferase involved in cell wall biosynthesis
MTRSHRLLGRLLNPFVSVTVANCAASRDAVLRDERPSPDSVIVLENGVDLSRFPTAEFTDHPARFGLAQRVGVVANLRPVKGLDVFVQAAALVARLRPNVAFEVAGDGDQRAELEQLASRLGIADQLVLRGGIRDIPAFLSTLDLAVLSSRAEGMSNSVLEYMAAGRPIVATAVGATPEVIHEGVHGLLVPPDDSRAEDRSAIVSALWNDGFVAKRVTSLRFAARSLTASRDSGTRSAGSSN